MLTQLQHDDLTEAQFEQIAALVRQTSGIDLRQAKRELVRARLGKRLRMLGLSRFDAYLDYVRQDRTGDEFVSMLDALSTNLTSFLREKNHFQFLTKEVLPQLPAGRVGARRRLRIWSAGCSSGEEPYTLAFVLSDALPDLPTWDARILATDLSTRVLAHAREGIYPRERLADLPAAWLSKYFTPVGTRRAPAFQVNAPLRQMVHFARLNLLETWPMHGPFDAIFCRNVMIYFDQPTRTRLVQRFERLLSPNGVLFVGHSESLAGIPNQLTYVRPTIYRRTERGE